MDASDEPDPVESAQATAGGDPDRTQTEAPAASTGDGVAVRTGAQLGRYQLLTLVGAGGMGIVWGAWDPELERRVAIKLLQQTRGAARVRMLREGQTLARAAHPNIVPVFDVGELGETLYLVMEWVSGTTLLAFAATKPGWRALLDAYLQAGLGLAAAHKAGVVHRDFKPDNAIRGDDGRVRVLDFGLAFAADGSASFALAGTRRYMAPEQIRGDAVTTASDQYAFAVALDEALTSAGEVPGWIAAVLARGRSVDPAARYPSMDAVLAALARDPAVRRRRLLLAGGAIIAAVAAFVVGTTRAHAPSTPAVEICSGAADELAPLWGATRRTAILDHLGAAMTPGQIDVVRGVVDHFAAGWIDEHRRTCLTNRRGELPPRQFESRTACLARTRARLGALADLLATVSAADADGAIVATRSLPDVTGCADAPAVIPPPVKDAAAIAAVTADVERALVHVQATQDDAQALADRAAANARTLGYRPLLAHALLVDGRAWIWSYPSTKPAAIFDEAMTTALAADDDATAVDAYARWLFVNAIQDHTDVGSLAAMQAIGERLGERGRFARTFMAEALAMSRFAAGDVATGRELLAQALVIRGDDPDPELYNIESNLGAWSADVADAEALWHTALARDIAMLGPDHLETLRVRTQLERLIRDKREAYAEITDVRRRIGTARMTKNGGWTEYEFAWLAEANGDRAAALASMEWLLAQGAAADPQAAEVFVAVVRDRPDAARLIAKLDADTAALTDPAAWAPGNQLTGFSAVAWARQQRGELDAATAAWARVAALAPTNNVAWSLRPVAEARAFLAERWARSKPAVARQLAADALTWYRGSASDAALVARLERIAAAR